jgi:lysophospholipase L1-like esterase
MAYVQYGSGLLRYAKSRQSIVIITSAAIFGIIAGYSVAHYRSTLLFVGKSLETLCNDVSCNHLRPRLRAIENQIDQAHGAHYLAIGDSFVEYATLPTICEAKPINAGIAGATATTFLSLSPTLINRLHPRFVIIGLGANDAALHRESRFQDEMERLIAGLPKGTKAILLPVPPSSGIINVSAFNAVLSRLHRPVAPALPSVVTLEDKIHLSAQAYVGWTNNLVRATEAICHETEK